MVRNIKIVVISSFMVLFYSLLFLSCDNENDLSNGKKEIYSNGKKEIDSRLVGGKWYNDRGNSSPNSFYRFTETTYGVASNGEETMILTSAYSENGKILDTNSGAVLLHYEFITASYYDTELATAIASGNHSAIYAVDIKIQAAKSGNMVKFKIPGSSQSFEWARWESVIPNPNGIIPSFLQGTWYRSIQGTAGSGIDTKLDKINIDASSFTSFGYDHYVSNPVDITYSTDKFDVVFNMNFNEYEINFYVGLNDIFTFRGSNLSNVLLLTATIYNVYNGFPNNVNYSFVRNKSERVFIPEWAKGRYTNCYYHYYSLRDNEYPFYDIIYDIIFEENYWQTIVTISEFKGYRGSFYDSKNPNSYSFAPIDRIVLGNSVEVDKTKLYFNNYYLERELNSTAIYFGSTDENNVFYNKLLIQRISYLN